MSEDVKFADITYSIYQLKDAPESRKLLFMPLRRLKSQEIPVLPERYDCVYSGQLAPAADRQTDQEFLDWMVFQFNMNHPQDFRGHSLSVSDVVTIDREGRVRAYYVDIVGFTEIPSFCAKRNPLRTAELSVEQNLNQIDGIINNLPHDKGKQPFDHHRSNDLER
jgi:hypothetical protein